MAEGSGYDEEERAWALRVARAFLAPAAFGDRRSAVGGTASVEAVAIPEGQTPNAERHTPPTVVLAVAVVPLAVPPEARGDEATRRRGDDGQEDDGGHGS